LIIRILFVLFFLTSICYSKTINELREEIPYYPNSIRYKMDKKFNAPIDAILVNATFEESIRFYYENMKKKGWKLLFPNEIEYKIWLEALNSDKSKNPVITLIFRKDKYNCNISISTFKENKYYYQTIISIYINMIE